MGKHPYGPPVDMDPETTICMRKIFEAIEDARLRGESDTSTLHYKRHTKMKRLNAMSHSQSVDSIESCGSRPEFVVRGLGTTADVPEAEMDVHSPPKSSKKKKRKKRRKSTGKSTGGSNLSSATGSLDDLGFSASDAELEDAYDTAGLGDDAADDLEYTERELYAMDGDARCVAYELLLNGRSTNVVRVVVYDSRGTQIVKDVPPDGYACTGYGPCDTLIDDEKAALASLLCCLVNSPDGNLDDLPRPYAPGPMQALGARPPSPVTAQILAEFDDDY